MPTPYATLIRLAPTLDRYADALDRDDGPELARLWDEAAADPDLAREMRAYWRAGERAD